MKQYSTFRYIFPPRPQTKSPSSGLNTFEHLGMWAQPKMNGSCGVLFLSGSTAKLMGRHNNSFARQLIPEQDLTAIHRGSGYMVLIGEYMNKSQRDSKGKLFNGCFVIFDILVYNGRHLINSTFEERQSILDSLYPLEPHDTFISKVSNSIYRAHNFKSDFANLWKTAIKTEMIEGFVLKKPTGKLEDGIREANNTGWQVKIRKATKNYQY